MKEDLSKEIKKDLDDSTSFDEKEDKIIDKKKISQEINQSKSFNQ